MVPKSELAWNLSHYQKAGVEPPDRIMAHPNKCEGGLMTKGEVDQHISDCIGTLLVLLDKGSPRVDKVRAAFLADLDFLLKVSKITEGEYNEITSSEEMMI